MVYERIRRGVFRSRPNRFIANVEIDGRLEVCHVKNTGRCRELLVPGAEVWLQESLNPERRTRFDLVTVKKGDILINMDSQAPNKVFGEYLAGGGLFESPTLIRPETVYGSSRFDFYVETPVRRAFCEVKGVTLEEGGVAMFPDAPTARGTKHMLELAKCVGEGYDAWAVFVVQMAGMSRLEPNRATDPAFADAVLTAKRAGVHMTALECEVTPESLTAAGRIPVRTV